MAWSDLPLRWVLLGFGLLVVACVYLGGLLARFSKTTERPWWKPAPWRREVEAGDARGSSVEVSGGTVETSGGSAVTRRGTVAAQGGSVEVSAGSVGTRGGVVATRGGSVEASAGSVGTRGGVVATQGGSVEASTGSVGTRGGVVATQGGSVEASTGSVETRGVVVATQGGSVEASAGSVGTRGGSLETSGGVVEASDEQAATSRAESDAAAPIAATERVVSLRLAPRRGGLFDGQRTVEILRGAGLKFGRYGIFHYRDDRQPQASGFSVANLVEPGSFDLTDPEGSTLPGMTFFLLLPGLGDPLQRFDRMVGVARRIAESLEAGIYDDAGNSWSLQREQSLREEIIEYRRRHLQPTSRSGSETRPRRAP